MQTLVDEQKKDGSRFLMHSLHLLRKKAASYKRRLEDQTAQIKSWRKRLLQKKKKKEEEARKKQEQERKQQRQANQTQTIDTGNRRDRPQGRRSRAGGYR